MSRPLRVLLVEDNPSDAQLVERELARGGFVVETARVDTRAAMVEALSRRVFDVVLSDYALPAFSGPAALACLEERRLDLPFILVSGLVNEEIAVEVMRAGAHDFIPKSNLTRLVPAIERELRDAASRAEKARIQGQLVVAERMASIGTLAVGVAHEINNPLAALIANLQFWSEEVARLRTEIEIVRSESPPASEGCRRVLASLDSLEEPVRDAMEAADRVRTIAQDLRHFARGDDEATGSVDVHRVLESSLRMARNEVRHRARLVQRFGRPAPVRANDGRLGQVFLNLLLNAAQAIPSGHADAHEIRVTTGTDDRGDVVVEVRDTGCGIDAAVLPRIFDPFFTTKPNSMGSGLGLAISARIVAGLGGRIDVESTAGAGSTFRVVLPAAPDDPHPTRKTAKITASGRGGKVLVVDDEPLLGSALRRMLTPRHEVTVAMDGHAALARIAAGERFDVVFCDLMMPELDGTELFAAVTQLAPGQAERFVFMTGGAFAPGARQFLEQVPNRRVEKPFDVTTIRRIVRELLS